MDTRTELSTHKSARIEMEFPADWRLLRDLRSFVGKLVVSVVDSNEMAQRVSMVVTELVENAVKYAQHDSAVVRLSVEPTQTGIRCETENHATPDNIHQLTQTLDLVNQGDPMAAYTRALVAVSEQERSSRIGLARIRYEGQMDLRCVVSDSVVRMIAEMAPTG